MLLVEHAHLNTVWRNVVGVQTGLRRVGSLTWPSLARSLPLPLPDPPRPETPADIVSSVVMFAAPDTLWTK
jgi:hypothetical protein